jgi:RNA polymerase sigma factor for flagellar operon FliA
MTANTVILERDEGTKERVVQEFLPFIRYTARRLSWRLPPGLSEEDLVSAGVEGLLDAFRKFRDGSAKLKTYAEYRIKGSMLDEIRAADTLPRTVRDRVNALKSAHRALERKLRRPPEDEEVAAALCVPLEEYHKTLRECGAALQLRFEDFEPRRDEDGSGGFLQNYPDAEGKDPLSIAEKGDLIEHLSKAIEELPERERLVLSLYYRDELTMKEIGRTLGVSEGRVCQLHGQALVRCKARLGGGYC